MKTGEICCVERHRACAMTEMVRQSCWRGAHEAHRRQHASPDCAQGARLRHHQHDLQLRTRWHCADRQVLVPGQGALHFSTGFFDLRASSRASSRVCTYLARKSTNQAKRGQGEPCPHTTTCRTRTVPALTMLSVILGMPNARPLCATSTGVPPAACCVTCASSSGATSLSWRTQSR